MNLSCSLSLFNKDESDGNTDEATTNESDEFPAAPPKKRPADTLNLGDALTTTTLIDATRRFKRRKHSKGDK